MRITHSVTGQTAEVDDRAYELVYKIRGWLPAEDADKPLPDIAEMTISDVHEYLAANPTRTAEVLEAEQAGKARKTLLAELEAAAEALPEPPAPSDPIPANEAPTDPADEAVNTTTEEPTS